MGNKVSPAANLAGANTETTVTTGSFDDGAMHSGWAHMSGYRKDQEDTHVAVKLPDGSFLFGVFDGHGGTAASRLVSKHLPHVFDLLLDTTSEATIIDSIEKSFRVMDRMFLKYVDENDILDGCTATCALVTRDKIFLINAGDSRSLLIRNKMLVAATEDHKPS